MLGKAPRYLIHETCPVFFWADPWYSAQPAATAQDAYGTQSYPAQVAPELDSETDTEASSGDLEIEEDWTGIAGLSEAQAAEQIF